MVEGNEILMVGFFENLATDPGFDLSEGSNQWAGEDTTSEGNVRYLGPLGSALNNVLHLANKLNPSRIFTINQGMITCLLLSYPPQRQMVLAALASLSLMNI